MAANNQYPRKWTKQTLKFNIELHLKASHLQIQVTCSYILY